MKFIMGIVAVLTIGILVLWATGYTFHIEKNKFEVIGPTRVSPHNSEAEANIPECQYERSKVDTSRVYTEREVEESADKAKACIDAKIRYIKAKKANKNENRGQSKN